MLIRRLLNRTSVSFDDFMHPMMMSLELELLCDDLVDCSHDIKNPVGSPPFTIIWLEQVEEGETTICRESSVFRSCTRGDRDGDLFKTPSTFNVI